MTRNLHLSNYSLFVGCGAKNALAEEACGSLITDRLANRQAVFFIPESNHRRSTAVWNTWNLGAWNQQKTFLLWQCPFQNWTTNEKKRKLHHCYYKMYFPAQVRGERFIDFRSGKWSLDQWDSPTHFISSHISSFPARPARLSETSLCLCSRGTVSSTIIWSSKP